MGISKAKWRGGQLAFYDGATYETVKPLAPRYTFDDFEASAIDPLIWAYCLTINEDTQALDGLGNASLYIDNAGTQQEAGIYKVGNVESWDTDKGLIVEYRINFSVLPTLAVEGLIGVLGENWVADKQIVAADDYGIHALFVVTLAGLCSIHTDDATNENGPIATGVTIVPGTYNVFRIDFTDIENVRFFIDGEGVGTGTTFDMSDMVSHLVQPFVNLTKSAAAGVGTMKVDYIKIWQATR